jgi:hypothetical protein
VIVASYRAGAGPDETLKVPLTFFILVLCETERFLPIKIVISQAWDSQAPQALFGCACIRLNSYVLKWIGVELNYVPFQSTPIHVE